MALDVGCNSGDLTVNLQSHFADSCSDMHILGVDVDPDLVAFARRDQGCAIVSLLRGILVLILHYYNSIGIVIEIGTAKKPRTILLLVLVLQFKLSQYWY